MRISQWIRATCRHSCYRSRKTYDGVLDLARIARKVATLRSLAETNPTTITAANVAISQRRVEILPNSVGRKNLKTIDLRGTKVTAAGVANTRPWPDLAALRNRVLCVLSGDGSSRLAYRWAFGSAPAIGANADGDIVLLHPSTIGDLNCWSGKADGSAIAVMLFG